MVPSFLWGRAERSSTVSSLHAHRALVVFFPKKNRQRGKMVKMMILEMRRIIALACRTGKRTLRLPVVQASAMIEHGERT